MLKPLVRQLIGYEVSNFLFYPSSIFVAFSKCSLKRMMGHEATASQLTSIMRGTGYRSSFTGDVATVFGASGCLGRGVCNRLGKSGTQMIIPYRADSYKVQRLKVCGDLGQVLFTPFNLKDENSIRKSLTHSNIVINLIGREFETRNFSFAQVNIEGPARLARLAKEAGAKTFIHLSHVNARENPEKVFLPRGSEFLRTKWLGEQAVLEEFPDATIIRSVDVYGRDDSFLTYYCSFFRRGYQKSMPLWAKGENTLKRPLHVSDLVSGIINSIKNPCAKGTTYEAYGPDIFLLSELIDWVHFMSRKDHVDFGYRRTDLRFSPLPFLKALIVQNLPIGQILFGRASIEKLEMTSLNDSVLGLPSLIDLGVEPARIVDTMPMELAVHMSFAHHNMSLSEVPNAEPPRSLNRRQLKNMISIGTVKPSSAVVVT